MQILIVYYKQKKTICFSTKNSIIYIRYNVGI